MLTLFRRVNDHVFIGERIIVRVLSVTINGKPVTSGAEVELGFEAPQHLKILRGELKRRIQQGLTIFKPTRQAA